MNNFFFLCNCTLIRMPSSAQCPVAKGRGSVMSAVEMPKEEWRTNHTVLTFPAPRSPLPASAPVASGALGSGLLWVNTSIHCVQSIQMFSALGTFSNLSHNFFPHNNVKAVLKQNDYLVQLLTIKYWIVLIDLWKKSSTHTELSVLQTMFLKTKFLFCD